MGVSLMVLFVSPRNSCRKAQHLSFAAMLSASSVREDRATTMPDAPSGLMPAVASATRLAARGLLLRCAFNGSLFNRMRMQDYSALVHAQPG